MLIIDPITKAKLERGKRTVEVLKQPLHKPLEVEKQVLILFALVNGYLDNVAIDRIKDFENNLFASLEVDELGQAILAEIRETKEIKDFDRVKEFLNKFVKEF